MTELSALNIKITGDAGDLKAAVAAANGDLARLVAGAEAAGLKVSGLGDKFHKVKGAADGNSMALRGVAQQLSQVGQQTMATGQFTQALAIQLPDIGLAFGVVGAAAGLLTGIALPLVVSAFMDTSEKATALTDATKELTAATEAFRLSAAAITLGIDRDEVLQVQELNRLMAELNRINAAFRATDSLGTRQRLFEEAQGIKANIALVQQQVDAYRAAREELAKAKAKADDVAKGVGGIVTKATDAKAALVAMVAAAPSGGWLSGAISDAGVLASKLWDAASAAAAARFGGDDERGSQRPQVHSATGFTRDNPLTGGGGGGGASPLAGELEALQTILIGQEEAQAESYLRQQETLRSALEQRLLTQQEYAALMEAAQQQHSDTMASIDVYRYGSGLQQAGQFMGDMANAFAGGNDRMIRMSRAFAATQGLIDAYGAYLKALNAPGGMMPLQRIAMAASVLAAGMRAVSAIKGGGGGGAGGAATGAAAASGGTTEMRTANINFYGGFQPTQETIGMIANGLNDWLGDGGRLNMRGV